MIRWRAEALGAQLQVRAELWIDGALQIDLVCAIAPSELAETIQRMRSALEVERDALATADWPLPERDPQLNAPGGCESCQ